MPAMLHWLGVKPSYSRARAEHKHSGIQFLSPAQRHAGKDHAILAARHAVYLAAKHRNPVRWSGDTRDWSPIGAGDP